MSARKALGDFVDRIRTAATYKLFMDDRPFTATRAAQEIEAQAAERSDLDTHTIRALSAHLRLMDEDMHCIPSVVRRHPTPEFIAYRVRLLKAFN